MVFTTFLILLRSGMVKKRWYGKVFLIVLIVLGEVGLADRWRSPLKSNGKLPAQLSKVLFSGRKPHFKAEDVSDEPIMSNFRCVRQIYSVF